MQILLFNHVYLVDMVIPFVYVLFIMILPYNISRYLLMFIAFFYGLTLDVFSSTWGLHAAATTFLAYVRPGIIRMVSNRDYSELNEAPGAHNGFLWFLKYTLMCVLLHHTFLYFAESFSLVSFISTSSKVLVGTVFSAFLVMVVEYISTKSK